MLVIREEYCRISTSWLVQDGSEPVELKRGETWQLPFMINVVSGRVGVSGWVG